MVDSIVSFLSFSYFYFFLKFIFFYFSQCPYSIYYSKLSRLRKRYVIRINPSSFDSQKPLNPRALRLEDLGYSYSIDHYINSCHADKDLYLKVINQRLNEVFDDQNHDLDLNLFLKILRLIGRIVSFLKYKIRNTFDKLFPLLLCIEYLCKVFC